MQHSYPRPDQDRSARWQSLDGTWEFFPDPRGSLTHDALGDEPESITVPGSWEESASGGRHDWLETGWYRRHVEIPADWSAETTVLTVGAAFLTTDVWFDGTHIASGTNGYLPLEATLPSHAAGTLVIRVTSPRDKRDVPHGKQRSLPYDDYNGCSFTPSSGIWQSVWIEPRPAIAIARIDLVPSRALDAIAVTVRASAAVEATVSVLLESTGESVRVPLVEGVGTVDLPITAPRLWSPADPHLYFVSAQLTTEHGTDTVRSYTGLRTFEARDGAFYLNGARIYLRGVLDQGYWPGSGIAAPDDQALVRDLELAAEAGFNLVRKHLKAEDPRWLYHADRMGMLVWAEPASTGRYSEAGSQAFEHALAGLVERDRNHPSIVIWCAYNEEWGLDWDIEASPEHTDAARRAYRMLRELDPTRPAIDNSGWSHVETDIVDWHYYNEVPGRFDAALAPMLRGEPFDVWHSANYPIPKLLGVAGFEASGQPVINSEYGGGWNSLERAWHTRWQTQYLRLQPTNQGYVYTELYDIENETVGIYTYDRRHKDEDGFRQNWAHAETVIAPLVVPVAYAADLVVPAGSRTVMQVMLSHHGASAATGILTWNVGDRTFGSLSADVRSFDLTGPFDVPIDGTEEGLRLHLSLEVHGVEIAHTFVDVVPHDPLNHLPADTGWRPTGLTQ